MSKPELQPSDFVHLHNHTQYSLLDGLTKVPHLIEWVKMNGMQSVAITDHGTLSGVVEFYKSAKQDDINPVIGMETYVAARKHTDKDPGKDKLNYHLILLAMNQRGYENLMRLSTIANLDGFYYKPRVDHDLLQRYNEGIIALSGCIGGEVGDALRRDQYDQAKKIATAYKKIFGDRYYIELQDHGHPDHPSKWDEQEKVNKGARKLAEELDIKCVLTADAHYLKHADQEAHEVLLCVQTGSFMSDEKRMSLKDFHLHVTKPEELIARWQGDFPEAITNTKEVADRCHVELELGKIFIPKFETPKGASEESYLNKLVFQGLAWRYGGYALSEVKDLKLAEAKAKLPGEVIERAQYELGIIKDMGFSGYFLIIADFINWGKAQGIVFGPGRGSAAGSIIAYALNITDLDPLKYDLLFERFLNPDRVSMPDIDIDIQDNRRDEVIQYCVDKYGEDKVANIVTFGRMAARNAVRDVARVLQVPYAEADRLAKMIPPPVQGKHIPLEKSLKDDNDLREEYESNETAQRVFDLAVQLEGTIRSHGVHAAGVVIAPDDIVKFVPLEMAQKGVVSTQYPMNPVEELGLLKMDFLGLSNLTIIKNALRIIRKVEGTDIDISHVPLDDEKTYQLFQDGATTGVFQFESAGMKRYLKELKPSVFDDLIAMVSLYRPGPMQFIDTFIRRKHGEEKIEYFHDKMKDALENTYGVLVYQEQVMQIARDMCGFSGGQSDTLRKAIGKKIAELMAKMKEEFIEGGIKHSGATREQMERFWKQLEDFAAYCFNKSHAACYALIAYQTAYLKAHYPSAFMAALMTSDFDDTDRLAIEITECTHLGIDVLLPDVNESFVEFAVVPDTKQIRFGMAAIKNVGRGAVEEILRARQDGKFGSLSDFFARVNPRIVNKKAIESLARAGAFSELEERGTLLHNIDVVLAYAQRLHKQKAIGQTDLFGGGEQTELTGGTLRLEQPPVPPIHTEHLKWERELLGIYVSAHPLEDYQKFLAAKTEPISSLKPDADGSRVTIGGSVNEVREITTKKGQRMAFVKIADTTEETELLLFPKIYEETRHLWEHDKIVLVKGKLSATDKDGHLTSEVKVIANDAQEITLDQANREARKKPRKKPAKSAEATAKPAKPAVAATPPVDSKLYLRIPSSQDQKTLMDIKRVSERFSGDRDVVLVIGDNGDRQVIKLPQKIDHGESTRSAFVELLGEDNVKLH
ncbi:MAG: DNA polymerase III subunit alpha [Candidatus Saccharibacteria bacterium]|nr:DNA polymerase III subunit alpha [Candidatus Saccharibacteria bacterium]